MMVREEAQRNGLTNNAALSAMRALFFTALWRGAAGEAPEMIIRRHNPACRCNGLRYFSAAFSCTFSRLIAEDKWMGELGVCGVWLPGCFISSPAATRWPRNSI